MKLFLFCLCFLISGCSAELYNLDERLPGLNTADIVLNRGGQTLVYVWNNYKGEKIIAFYYRKYNKWNLEITKEKLNETEF